jgi:hypothetical protein
MRMVFMDEKRGFIDEKRTLWMRMALVDENSTFYGKKNTSPDQFFAQDEAVLHSRHFKSLKMTLVIFTVRAQPSIEHPPYLPP